MREKKNRRRDEEMEGSEARSKGRKWRSEENGEEEQERSAYACMSCDTLHVVFTESVDCRNVRAYLAPIRANNGFEELLHAPVTVIVTIVVFFKQTLNRSKRGTK